MSEPVAFGPDSAVRGALLIVAAVLLMSLADGLIKGASASLPMWQIYVGRGLVAVPLLAVLAILRGGKTALRLRAGRWVVLRSLLLTLTWVAYYAALPDLSLAVAAVALYTAPLFIALLSARVTREPVGRRLWTALLLGFAGVVLVLRPWSSTPSWSVLLPILGAVCYALAMAVTRRHCRRDAPLAMALSLNASLLAAGLAAGAAIHLFRPDSAALPFLLGPWAPPGARGWLLLALLGLLIVVYSTAVARAYQIAPPATVAAFDYAYLIFAALWGYLLFGERPDSATVLGIGVIAVAGWLAVSRAAASWMPAGKDSRRRWWRRPAP